MNSNSKPTSGLNSFRSKYQIRISSASVRAFHTRATGALKVRSTMTDSAKFVFVVMFVLRSLCFFVRFHNSEHVAVRICRISEPADFRNRHLGHADLSAALLNLLQRLIE